MIKYAGWRQQSRLKWHRRSCDCIAECVGFFPAPHCPLLTQIQPRTEQHWSNDVGEEPVSTVQASGACAEAAEISHTLDFYMRDLLESPKLKGIYIIFDIYKF